MTIKTVLLLILLFSATITDLLTQQIKNILLLPFFLLGLILNGYTSGLAGLGEALLASLIPVLFFGLLFALKMLGAGDIKLYSAVGALMGVSFINRSILFSALAGGFFAVIIMLYRRNARYRLHKVWLFLKYCFLTRSLPEYNHFSYPAEAAEEGKGKFPYSCVITAGVLLALWL